MTLKATRWRRSTATAHGDHSTNSTAQQPWWAKDFQFLYALSNFSRGYKHSGPASTQHPRSPSAHASKFTHQHSPCNRNTYATPAAPLAPGHKDLKLNKVSHAVGRAQPCGLAPVCMCLQLNWAASHFYGRQAGNNMLRACCYCLSLFPQDLNNRIYIYIYATLAPDCPLRCCQQWLDIN